MFLPEMENPMRSAFQFIYGIPLIDGLAAAGLDFPDSPINIHLASVHLVVDSICLKNHLMGYSWRCRRMKRLMGL